MRRERKEEGILSRSLISDSDSSRSLSFVRRRSTLAVVVVAIPASPSLFLASLALQMRSLSSSLSRLSGERMLNWRSGGASRSFPSFPTVAPCLPFH